MTAPAITDAHDLYSYGSGIKQSDIPKSAGGPKIGKIPPTLNQSHDSRSIRSVNHKSNPSIMNAQHGSGRRNARNKIMTAKIPGITNSKARGTGILDSQD